MLLYFHTLQYYLHNIMLVKCSSGHDTREPRLYNNIFILNEIRGIANYTSYDDKKNNKSKKPRGQKLNIRGPGPTTN